MTVQLTLSAHEAAAMLGVSPSTVYEQVRQGLIPNVAVGTRVSIPRVWVEQRFAAAGAPLSVDLAVVEEATFTFT